MADRPAITREDGDAPARRTPAAVRWRLRPTLFGWLALAEGFGLVSTLAWQQRPLGAMLGAGLLAAVALNAVLAPRRLRALRAEHLTGEKPIAGENAMLCARLIAEGGSAPFALESVDPTHQRREVVGQIPGLGSTPARLAWPVRFPRRGPVPLAPLVASTDQPFGLVVAWRVISAPGETVVLPPIGLLRRDLRERLDRWLESLAAGEDRGDDEIAHLRPYRPGDAPHGIHWRASARARALLVAERHAPAARHLALVIDTDRILITPRRLDRLASVAATFVDHLGRRGWDLSLHGRFAPAGVVGNRARLLETLALLMPDDPTIPLSECLPPGRPCVVLTSRPLEVAASGGGPRPLVLSLDECEALVRLPKRARLG